MRQAAYFLLDTRHADYKRLIQTCRAEHERNAKGCNLSVAMNVAGTQALVKVAGEQRTLLKSRAVLDTAVGYEEHRKFVAMVATKEWTPPDEESTR